MIRYSNTLAVLAAKDSRIQEYEHDPVDGHFLHLANGYKESDYGAHSLRSDTVSGIRAKLYLIEKE